MPGRRRAPIATTAAALMALGAAAATAQGAPVKTSTYSLTEIRQVSVLKAVVDNPTAGDFDYRVRTSFRFTGRAGANRFTVRHTGRATTTGITRRAQRGERTGSMEFLSNRSPEGTEPFTCAFQGRTIPPRERSVSVLVVPPALNTTRRPKKLQINVQGPNAIEEISKAVRVGRCRTPILSAQRTLGRGRQLPLDYYSFTVVPDKLQARFRGSRRNVVLRGKRTSIVKAGTTPIGTITVTTTVRLKLLAST
jgi:hypothetical protein